MGDALLFIHIAAVAIWVGAGVTQVVVSPAMQTVGGAAAVEWMRQVVRLGKILFSPAAVVVLVTGVAMVIDDAFYEFEQAFVVIGFIAVIAGAVLGMRVYGPRGTEIAALHEAGKPDEAARKLSGMLGIATAEIAFLLFTIWAMVTRLGI